MSSYNQWRAYQKHETSPVFVYAFPPPRSNLVVMAGQCFLPISMGEGGLRMWWEGGLSRASQIVLVFFGDDDDAARDHEAL